MTREEARKILENLKEHTLNYQSGLALDMGISALSAEGEYIKKEDAIEAINSNIADYIPRFIGRQVEIPLRLASAINKIPAVLSPNREKGEWIITYPNGKYNPLYECPKCKASNNAVFKNFCPNCGADMRGKADTETWNGIHAQITAPKGTFDKLFEEAKESDEDDDFEI